MRCTVLHHAAHGRTVANHMEAARLLAGCEAARWGLPGWSGARGALRAGHGGGGAQCSAIHGAQHAARVPQPPWVLLPVIAVTDLLRMQISMA